MEQYNKRMIKILHLFVENKKILNSEQIALSVGVSSRTIRTDLKELDRMLKTNGASIVAETGSGYRLEIINNEAFNLFFSGFQKEVETVVSKDNVVPSDPQDRAMFIMHRLLMNTLYSDSEIIDPYDLADELFISISTLKKDIKVIDRILDRFSLRVILSSQTGVHIKGDEAKIRYCISEFIFNRSSLTTVEMNGFYEDIFPSEDAKRIREILLGVMEHMQIRLTDIAFKNLLIHIVIMLKRINHQQKIDYDDKHMDILKSSNEFFASVEIIDKIQSEMSVDLHDEVYYLTQHLISSKKFLTTDFNAQEVEYENKASIEEIIDQIKMETGIDLSDDTQLISGLAIHLNVALNRLRFHMNIRNDFLDSMKSAYPYAFELAVKASEIIERIYEIRTNENEIGFLAVHFGAALERKGLNDKGKVVNAIIVCASGVAMAMLVKEKIKQHFQNCIHIVKTCPLYEVDEALIDEVDLVLATVPMDHIKSDKIIQIHVLLNQEDINQVEKAIHHNQVSSNFQLKSIFREDLYMENVKGASCDEVLNYITDYMICKDYMDEKTKQSIFKREEMATTELGSMVAMPHALQNDMDEAMVAVAILEKPILWDREKVQVVLLLSIPKSAYGMWEEVFKSLYGYLIANFGVQKLMKGCTYDEFIKDLEYQSRN